MIGSYLITACTAGAGFAAVYVPLTVAFRWWLHGHASATTATQAVENKPPEPQLDAGQAQRLVTRLHEVAMKLTRDLGEHNASMNQINAELTSIDVHDGAKAVEVVVRTVERIAQANRNLTSQLESAQSTIEQQSALLEAHMADALRDALTGIANRRAFDHELGRRHAEWQRMQTPFSLLMVDVDHFKRFNDQHGHQAGDEVLRGVAQVLSKNVRDMDLVARYGGEEFSIILPGTDLESGKVAAERVRNAVEGFVLPHQNTVLKVTTSVGLARIAQFEDAAELVRRSDDALYASKNAGRNCAHYHDGTRSQPIGTQTAKPPVSGKNEPARKSDRPEPKPAGRGDSRPTPPTDSKAYDPLTGLPTRWSLTEHLRHRIAEWRRTQTPVSVVVLELDDFDRIQDLGPKATDFVVDAVARLLSAASREMDLVARAEDHRFAIMLPQSNLHQALVPAERVRKAIAACEKLKHQGTVVRFTVSAGVAEVASQDDAETLVERAETAMRQAAARGNNRTYFHNGQTCEPVMSAVGAGELRVESRELRVEG